MSQQQPQQQPPPPASHNIKDDGRDSRLSFRNFAEAQLRKEFKAEAMKKCDLQVGALAECIQEQGLWAPFKCREIQKDVNECMTVYNSPERFELFKKEHQDEIDSKPYVQAGR
jgi:carboxypeptidase C (cathepsin A)